MNISFVMHSISNFEFMFHLSAILHVKQSINEQLPHIVEMVSTDTIPLEDLDEKTKIVADAMDMLLVSDKWKIIRFFVNRELSQYSDNKNIELAKFIIYEISTGFVPSAWIIEDYHSEQRSLI